MYEGRGMQWVWLVYVYLVTAGGSSHRVDYDDDRGGFGGGALKAMQRQGITPMDTSSSSTP